MLPFPAVHSPEILERSRREIFRRMKSSGGKGSGENVFYEFEILCFLSSSHVMKRRQG